MSWVAEMQPASEVEGQIYSQILSEMEENFPTMTEFGQQDVANHLARKWSASGQGGPGTLEVGVERFESEVENRHREAAEQVVYDVYDAADVSSSS